MLTPEAILYLPHLRVQNANAISSPLTWGFSSPSAFTGFVHALARRLGSEMDLDFDGVGIICHDFQPLVSNPAGKRTKVFHLTRNPLTKDEKTAPIVEEGRAHLEVSLLIGVWGDGLVSGEDLDEQATRVLDSVQEMRIAGGTLLPSPTSASPRLFMWPGSLEEEARLSRQIGRRLLPGFALVSREDLLESRLAELRAKDSGATELDAFLELSSLNWDPPETDDGEWRVRRKEGWVVPIPAGYNALSPLHEPGSVRNARDKSVPFRFVESLFTVGQWLSPHRIHDVRRIFWQHQADAEAGIYRWSTPDFVQTKSSTEGK